MMDFHYPIRRPDKTPFTDANELYQALEREVGGYYLLGANGFWHGGIHISDRSAPHCVLDDALCCMADGEVVAYRLNDNYRESTFGDGASAKKLKYSNSFCLIRHEYRSPPNPEEGANHGKQNTLTFYSLYMHLLPYNHYQSSERLRPSYWQGKARGTAHRRLPLYNAPLNQAEGEPAGTRIGKLELCVSSVVEFDSQEVVTLRIGDQRHRMVQCTLVSGGCWGPESVPPTFWTIVDDSFLRWETVTPTVFNRVVSANTRIKAGDPIGYLGQIENIRSEEGETDSRYQVHLEIFTADADVRDFLQNAAGLKTGKQYLHLPNGTVLRKQAPSAESITLTRPHALELSKTPLVQDGGEDCYAVRVIENDQPVSGLLMKADAHIITQHDWEKLGFQIVEEQDPMADGFLDVEAMPPFFRDLFAKLDTNRDGTLSADELTAGLRNPALHDQWARLVAHHPTEWQEKAASPKWRRLDKLFGDIPKALKHEKQRIDNFVFWDQLPATVGLTSGLIYHFHPIAFIEAMRGSVNIPYNLSERAATRDTLIRKVRSLGRQFVERAQWKALPPKNPLEEDWDYSMVALHHAGRSYSCSPGLVQMSETQRNQIAEDFDDIGYHFGIDCEGVIYEGRDIRFKGSNVRLYNTGVIGIVLLNNLTTAEEGSDLMAFGRTAAETLGLNTTNQIPVPQVDALLDLITAVKSVFMIKHFGGHREYPGQEAEGKICPGNVGMELVRIIRSKNQLLPPPTTSL